MIHRKNAFEALKGIHHATKLIAAPFKFTSVQREMFYQRSSVFVFIHRIFASIIIVHYFVRLVWDMCHCTNFYLYLYSKLMEYIVSSYWCFIITLYIVLYRLRICWRLLRERTLCNSISFICIRKDNKKDILCASHWIICWLNQTKYVTLSIC